MLGQQRRGTLIGRVAVREGGVEIRFRCGRLAGFELGVLLRNGISRFDYVDCIGMGGFYLVLILLLRGAAV